MDFTSLPLIYLFHSGDPIQDATTHLVSCRLCFFQSVWKFFGLSCLSCLWCFWIVLDSYYVECPIVCIFLTFAFIISKEHAFLARMQQRWHIHVNVYQSSVILIVLFKLDHLIKEVSASLLHCNATVLSFWINKYLGGYHLKLKNYPFSSNFCLCFQRPSLDLVCENYYCNLLMIIFHFL